MVVIQSASAAAMIKVLTRTCPKCHRNQVVPISQGKKTVKCKFCGTLVAPNRKKI